MFCFSKVLGAALSAVLVCSMTNLLPANALPTIEGAQTEQARPTIAYIHGNASSAEDELNSLSSRSDRSFAYREFTPDTVELGLWDNINDFHVVVIELQSDDMALIATLTQHKALLEHYAVSGGRLYVTLVGTWPAIALSWLPGNLHVGDKTSERLQLINTTATSLLSKPNKISQDFVNRSIRNRHSLRDLDRAYVPLLSGEVSGQAYLLVATAGSGIVIVSSADLETGFNPEWVENVIDPLPLVVVVVGKLVISAVASYIAMEYFFKPVGVPCIVAAAKKYNITQLDTPAEAETLMDAVEIAISVRGTLKSSSKAITQYALAKRATGRAVGGHMRWAYGNGVEALKKVDEELIGEVIDRSGIPAMDQQLRARISSALSPCFESTTDINAPSSYPYYLENKLPDGAFAGLVDPVLGFSKFISVPAGASRMRVVVAWDVLSCGPYFTLVSPSGASFIPVPKYIGGNAVEISVELPASGQWQFKVNPIAQLVGQEIGGVVDIGTPVARVLFDATHGERFAANGSWRDFANELRRAGYLVDVKSSGALNLTELSQYDVLVVGGWATLPFSPAERTAVDQYVRSGGGLMLSYDEGSSSVYNSLAQPYGVQFIDEAGLDDPTDDEPSTRAPVLHVFGDHPIFEGLDAVQFYYVHYLSSVNPPSVGVLYTDGDTVDRSGQLAAYKPMVAIAEVETGRVVSVADANLWNNWDWDRDGSADLYDRDNLSFGLNIIAWLSGVQPQHRAFLAHSNHSGQIPETTVNGHLGEDSGSLSGYVHEDQVGQFVGVTPHMAEQANAVSVVREHEATTLDAASNVIHVINTLTLYGTGTISTTDNLPSNANVNFGVNPTSDVVIGASRKLSWMTNVSGYQQIVYTATNTALTLSAPARFTIQPLPGQIGIGAPISTFLKIDSVGLGNVSYLSLDFDVPKNTPQFDITVGDTEVAQVSDRGSNYALSVPFGGMALGERRSVLVPIILTPRQVGDATIAYNLRATAGESSSVYLGQSVFSTAVSNTVGRSLTWPLPNVMMAVSTQSTSQAVINTGIDVLDFSVAQGLGQTSTLFVENVGNAADSVSFSIAPANAGLQQLSTMSINPSWFILPAEFTLAAGGSIDTILRVNVPLDVPAGVHMGTLGITTGSQTYQYSVRVRVAPKDLIKDINVVLKPDFLVVNRLNQVLVCAKDAYGEPLSAVQIRVVGAALDVDTVTTDDTGCTSATLMPKQMGQVRITASKDTFVTGEQVIWVSRGVHLPIMMR